MNAAPLTHNVELPVGFHELAGDLWVLRTAGYGFPIVLDGRHEAHLGARGVHVEYFILCGGNKSIGGVSGRKVRILFATRG